jgi:two-component system response regulator RstA
MSCLKILLIEDDDGLAALLSEYLRPHGFTVERESRGDRAVRRVLADRPHLIILDLLLPGQDGLSICRQLRPSYPGPILMLTGRGEPTDQVVGLEVGADDYLAKPVLPRLLLARIRALLRRASAPARSEKEPLVLGELFIEPALREVRIRDTIIPLTSGEFDLLFLLASSVGQVVTRASLYERLRGADQDEFDRSIDLRISRLRQKLSAELGERQVIKTVRGIGYQLIMS